MITQDFDIETLEQYISDGWIMKNKHPKHDLWIYNYTQSTQYERFWNAYTTMCRGIILDADYNVVARPLPKFFNYEEHDVESIPKSTFEIYEKLDGSLGVLYWIGDQPYISTRNSFNSKQALKANEMLCTQYASVIQNLARDKTYVFEIIYPDNRIVVDYGKEEKLVLLAVIDTTTGQEEQLPNIGFPLPQKLDGLKDFTAIKALNWDNHEGFVIKFKNGFRLKIKFENYVNLHKIITQISSISIWEQLSKGDGLHEWIENVPDEFYAWVKATENKLLSDYNTIELAAKAEYKELSTKKETALYFLTCEYTSILFAMLNGKPYKDIIWKRIRPPFEKAYCNDIN